MWVLLTITDTKWETHRHLCENDQTLIFPFTMFVPKRNSSQEDLMAQLREDEWTMFQVIRK